MREATHHTQNGQGEKGRSSARVFIALESTSGELRLRGSGRPTTSGHRTAHGEKGRSSTRVNIGLSTLESCEDVKRLSYDVVEEQRVLKLRPSCLESNTAGMRNRSERMAHSVQCVPTFEADFLESKARSLGHFSQREAGIPLGRPSGEQGSIRLIYPGLGKEPPGFSGNETLEKPNTALSIAAPAPVGKGFGALRPKVFNLVTKHFRKSLAHAFPDREAATSATG